MTDRPTLETRRETVPHLEEVSTLLWDQSRGFRFGVARMRQGHDQTRAGKELLISQSMVSKIETGKVRVCERITVYQLKQYLGTSFSFVVFGTNPERFNVNVITAEFWGTRLRRRRADIRVAKLKSQ